jgi:hypothetical protein
MNLGASASLALRQAKLEMLHAGPPAYRQPYFWAPFCFGGAVLNGNCGSTALQNAADFQSEKAPGVSGIGKSQNPVN